MKRDDMISISKEAVRTSPQRAWIQGITAALPASLGGSIDLLTIQFDRWGGGFVIEISKCSLDGITTLWGEHVPPNRVSAWDVNPPNRPRLGAPRPQDDGHWFRFDDGTPTDKVATLAVSYLREADQWWGTADSWWKTSANHSTSQ